MTTTVHKHGAGKHVGHAKHDKAPWIKHKHAMDLQERALDSMHPVFRARVAYLLEHLIKKGWQPFVYQGKNRSRAQAENNAKIGVGIKKSWHRPDIEGRLGNDVVELYAADIVDERWGWEGPAKNLGHPFWKDLGEYAQAVGLEWGGNWKKKDVAHVQMALIESAPPRSVTV